MVCVLAASAACSTRGMNREAQSEPTSPTSLSGETPTTTITSTVPTTGRPYGTVPGLLTFRGNPTRTYYGEGPVPTAPAVLRRFPDQPMCSESSDGASSRWCGTGWTGQPAVFEREGRTWLVFGAFDRA
ncbi:MAG: hypothetical protein M3143_04050, partial [Actinomycetota bacterium]|nr:hypothetical protein [Actinomycetota bacterium]